MSLFTVHNRFFQAIHRFHQQAQFSFTVPFLFPLFSFPVITDWQRHPQNPRANETSALNPIAKPPLVRPSYQTTSGVHANFFQKSKTGRPQTLTEAGHTVALEDTLEKLAQSYRMKPSTSAIDAKERVRLAHQRERELENYFKAEARYALGLTDTPPNAPSAQSARAEELAPSTLGSMDPFTLTARGKELAAARQVQLGASADLSRWESYRRSLYPTDFGPTYLAMTSNMSHAQPYRGTTISTAKEGQAAVKFNLPPEEKAVPHFRYNFHSLQR